LIGFLWILELLRLIDLFALSMSGTHEIIVFECVCREIQMAKKTSKQMTKATAVKDYVTVAFAEDMDLARQYQQLLADNEIAAVVKRQPEMAQNGFSDIAILVPESLLDEAHALISEEASYDDFFDMLFNDSDNDRTDSGYNENFDNDDDYY
jgi:hypothetical protein